MKLGLFIANLETLRNEHGADIDIIGALVDVVQTGEAPAHPDHVHQMDYGAILTSDAPVFLLVVPPPGPTCDYCGEQH